jgi:hypothetical protein
MGEPVWSEDPNNQNVLLRPKASKAMILSSKRSVMHRGKLWKLPSQGYLIPQKQNLSLSSFHQLAFTDRTSYNNIMLVSDQTPTYCT